MCCAGNMCLVAHFLKTFYFTVSSKRNSCGIWCVVFVRWSWFFFMTAWGEYFWTGDDWSHVRGRGAVPTGTPERRGAQGQRWVVILSVLLAERKEGSLVCCQEEPLLQIPDWICTYSYVRSVSSIYLLKHNVASGRNEHMPAWFFQNITYLHISLYFCQIQVV